MAIGSAYPLGATQEIAVRGGTLAEGMPRQFCVNSGEILDCLQVSLGAITCMVHRAMERTPPELSADMAQHGLVLTGGGAFSSMRTQRAHALKSLALRQQVVMLKRSVESREIEHHDGGSTVAFSFLVGLHHRYTRIVARG
jgi:actin-like ATPase involved in cell morphogenesis